jgi:DNA-binding MltR family transcriptional regulator
MTKYARHLESFGRYFDAHLAIVTTAALEELLEKALLTQMRPLSRKIKDRLFEGYGPMANFSPKIDLAYALRVISKDDYDVLMVMKKVRDIFAHRSRVSSFEDPKIATILSTLKTNVNFPNMRDRYCWALNEVNCSLVMIIAPDLLEELDEPAMNLGSHRRAFRNQGDHLGREIVWIASRRSLVGPSLGAQRAG